MLNRLMISIYVQPEFWRENGKKCFEEIEATIRKLLKEALIRGDIRDIPIDVLLCDSQPEDEIWVVVEGFVGELRNSGAVDNLLTEAIFGAMTNTNILPDGQVLVISVGIRSKIRGYVERKK